MAVAQAVVVDHAPPAGRHPFPVQSLQPVRIPHALGRTQMDAGVAYLQALAPRSQARRAAEIHRIAVGRYLNQVRHRTERRRFARARIQHRQAPAGGKPETAVGSADPSAGCGITRGALRAAQPVVHPVVLRLQPGSLPGAELRELAFGDPADAARGTQPERFAIVEHLADVVAQQPVPRPVVDEPAVAQGIQPPAECADPKRALRILVERADLIARKAVGSGELPALIPLDSPQAFPVGARPDRAVASLAQRHHEIDQQRTARHHVLKLLAADYASVLPEPPAKARPAYPR